MGPTGVRNQNNQNSGNNKSTGGPDPNVIPNVSESKTLWIPSLEACQQFGIERRGAKKLNLKNKYSFLNGPQFSDFLEPESDDKPNCLDEVVLDFIGNAPTSLRPQKDPATGIVRMTYDLSTKFRLADPYFRIKIVSKQVDWLNFNFEHSWEEKEGIIGKALEFIGGLADVLNGWFNAGQNALNRENPIALKNISIDKQDTYKGTNKISFEIPFLLFTMGKPLNEKDNFIKRWISDIYKPLILLTAWTHPKRAVEVFTTKTGQKIDTSQDNALQVAAEEAKKEQDKDSSDDPSIQESVLRFLSSFPGVRIAISEPPSYVRVFHTSGFFKFDLCAITKVSYKFLGPWVKASTMFPDDYSMKNMKRELLDISLPLVVEGSIGIRVIEKLYADDWIIMFENSPILKLGGDVGQSVINITKNRYGYEEQKKEEIERELERRG